VAEISYNTTAAHRYEQAFAHVTAHFIPRLLRAAALAPGQSVLDVATCTGLAAEAALGIVGPDGQVTASDASASMAEQARHRRAGGGSTGEAITQLPEAARQEVREEVRRSLGDTGGPVTIPVEFRIASGRK
jgi:ubiquinone/menaquinone biosynthesis C-methylase UbiE